MALVLKDRVRESSTSSGTGSITLGGAFVGYQTFASAIASGSTVYYTIHNTTPGNEAEWEVGVGTFTSPSTLSRDTVFSSSAGGTTKVNFTGSSILEVFITQPAEQAVYINQATNKVEAFGNGTNSISFANITADLFTGNASAISAINASNVSSGTIDNARTTAATANGASTIVLRDANGSFAGNVITGTTGTFTSVSGNGVALTAINASNISSGTVANARTTASDANGASTIVTRDANGSFTANIITANGSAISAINASNISSGTVATARLGTGTANASTFLRGDQTYAVPASGTTITDDTSTNATRYVLLTSATSGSISAANVSNTKLFFNPSTGTLTATVLTSNSDERQKENWTDVAPDFISKLAQVKHGVFSRIDSGNREPGVTAQSLQKVIPEAVVEGADGYLSVNYGGAALVSAIELAKVVEELRAEIAQLKAR